MKILNLCLALSIVHIAGCGSTIERPTAQIAAAETGLTLAEQNGAEQHSLEQLTMAREKLDRAGQSVDDERFAEAEKLAAEAEVDARLAASLASLRKAELAIEESNAALEALEAEIDVAQ